MNSLTKARQSLDLHKLQQIIKWTVYSLLIVNFGFYIWEDVDRAIHTLHAGSTLFDLTGEFATSIDTSAWFILLLMFELETYQLEDKQWTGWVAKTVHGARIVCYLMIAHTVIAFVDTVIDYRPTQPVEGVSSLCDLSDDGISFVYNLEYTEVGAGNCASLTTETEFYRIAKNPLVTTYEGLELERDLAWSDLIEVLVWLIIIFAIEVVVRMQGKGITAGSVMSTLKFTKLFGYAILFVLAIYWANLGHWLYTWDTFLWVGGFTAIEMNVSEWRDEILDSRDALSGAAAVPTVD